MSKTARLLTALGAVLMLAAYIAPLWRIDLIAPQYPEGLGLRIWVDQISGSRPNDLNSINGLNHYIGMRAIKPDAIPELRLMPWILAGLVASALGVAALGSRRLLGSYLVLAVTTAFAGLADFWKWGYEYGHQLDPHAIIKVPGMSYQPPLVGVKQLLNFQATSWPDLGGIAIMGGMLLVAAGFFVDRRRAAPKSGSIRSGQPSPAAE